MCNPFLPKFGFPPTFHIRFFLLHQETPHHSLLTFSLLLCEILDWTENYTLNRDGRSLLRGISCRIFQICIIKFLVGCGYVDWIGLAQDRDRWRTLVSAVMNLRVP